MSNLIEQIKNRASDETTIHDMVEGLSPKPQINAKVSLDELNKIQDELGFKFPELLVKIYTEIGNGGFGPGYGFYSMEDAKKIYLDMVNDPENEWDKGTWPLCTWGCGIDSYVDCLDDGFPIYYTNQDFEDGHNQEGNLSFTLTDKDGNIISAGNSNSISDLLNSLSNEEENISEDDEEEENEEEVGLLYHKDTMVEWLNDWVNNVDIWEDMMGEEEDDDDEENEERSEQNNIPRRPGTF